MRHHADMDATKKLLKVEEVWELLGRDRVGREALYRFCREHGIRLGKRLLVPTAKVEALLQGRLDLLGELKAPRGGARD